ncbi:LEM protein 2-like [Centruroides sculpturatus]|uniref:LEM protein 2-like n=1 Tax=Centruroides sculpturatus TaxID=218467 RepID=UPI000C6DD1B4|nr:LEM protein 2-like [Centruroides sculpturatus]
MAETELNEVTIKQLSDEELYQKLKDLGGPVGPIVQSTRSVYERKLLQKLNGPVGSDTSEHSEQDETEIDYPPPKYYPETKVISPPKFQFRNSSSHSSSSSTITSTEFRYRTSSDTPFKREGMYFDPTNLARSSYRADLKNAKHKSNIYGEAKTSILNKQEPAQKSKTTKVVFVIIFIVIIIVCLVVYNMESNAPIPIPQLKHP